jgi:hypothetical protein
VVAAGAVASLALVVAAGCSSSPSGSSSTTTTVQTVDASKDVKVTACKVDNKVWLMNGSIHNSSDAKRRYTVVVDFTTEPGNKVVTSRKILTEKIAPGARITFGASGADGAIGVSCVISKATATT